MLLRVFGIAWHGIQEVFSDFIVSTPDESWNIRLDLFGELGIMSLQDIDDLLVGVYIQRLKNPFHTNLLPPYPWLNIAVM